MSTIDSCGFKLNLSSLIKLNSTGDNYSEWCASWKLAFKFVDLWEVIEEKPPTFTASTSEEIADYKKWEKANSGAKLMMIIAVHDNHITLVTDCPTAHDAWNTLRGQFDRDKTKSTMLQVRHLFSMRYNENEDLVKHINDFHRRWSQLERRCRSSTHGVSKNFSALFSSESIKGAIFLTTLPDSMNSIADNFGTRGISEFVDIRAKMLP